MNDQFTTIQNLQQTIVNLKRELAGIYAQKEREMKAELSRLERKMHIKNQQDLRELENKYRDKMKEYERLMRGETAIFDQRLQEEIRTKNQEIQNLKNQMQTIEQQLNNQVKDLKLHLHEDSERKKKIAREYEQEFKEVLNGFDDLPHIKFTPKKLDTIAAMQEDMNTLEKGKMYEAKAAVAISGTSSLHRLEIEVKEFVSKWKSEYLIYKQYVSHLYHTILNHMEMYSPDYATKEENIERNELFYQDDFDNNKQNLVKEIDYWAFGKYRCCFERFIEEMKCIQDIEKMGVDNYLLKDDSLSLAELNEKAHTVYEVLNQINLIDSKAMDNQQKSKDRVSMMRDVLHAFEIRRDANIVLIANERPHDDASKEYVDYKILAKELQGDTRKSIHGVLEVEDGVYIHIYIRPEDLGAKYRNVIILYDDFIDHGYLTTMEQDDYKMLIGILNDLSLQIDQYGNEKENNWFIPYINMEAITYLRQSKDSNISKFAGELHKFIKSR